MQEANRSKKHLCACKHLSGRLLGLHTMWEVWNMAWQLQVPAELNVNRRRAAWLNHSVCPLYFCHLSKVLLLWTGYCLSSWKWCRDTPQTFRCVLSLQRRAVFRVWPAVEIINALGFILRWGETPPSGVSTRLDPRDRPLHHCIDF